LCISTDYLLKGSHPEMDISITDAQRKILRELRQAFDDAWFEE
jgi:hypothetical protein